MVRAGSTTLKVIGTAGSLLVCGASAVAVITDTKPAAAPLRPPVDTSAAPPAAPADGALLIPPSTPCAGAGGSQPARPAPPPSPDPEIAVVVAQIRAATSAAQRRAILMQLSATERMQVTAYLKLAAGGRANANRCIPGGAGATPPSPSTAIDPSVITGGAPGAPVVVSAVS